MNHVDHIMNEDKPLHEQHWCPHRKCPHVGEYHEENICIECRREAVDELKDMVEQSKKYRP